MAYLFMSLHSLFTFYEILEQNDIMHGIYFHFHSYVAHKILMLAKPKFTENLCETYPFKFAFGLCANVRKIK